MESLNPSKSPPQHSTATCGKKRYRSSSLPSFPRKQPSLLSESSPPGLSSKIVQVENNWHCPNCGRPCWGCFSPPEAPLDIASFDEDDDIDRLRMNFESQTTTQTQSGTPQYSSTISSRKKRTQCFKIGKEYVGPKDELFEDAILTPLGVVFSPSTTPTLIDIFGSQISTPVSRVIIRKETEELEKIVEDFQVYKTQGYDEHTLTTICFDSIVLRDRFVHTPLFGEDECITTSMRRDKWKPKKDGPRIPPSKYVYDWDIEPGTTYAVSIRIFNIEQRWELMGMECKPWVAEDGAVCPYLTIEYKCRAKNGKPSHAMYQNTAASVLWLHQRKQIRHALGLSLAGLKHFSISFVDSNYTISEACFQDGFYDVRELVQGNVTQIDDLRRYIEWSNAIHSWGLGPNASSFNDDMAALLDSLCDA